MDNIGGGEKAPGPHGATGTGRPVCIDSGYRSCQQADAVTLPIIKRWLVSFMVKFKEFSRNNAIKNTSFPTMITTSLKAYVPSSDT